MEYKLEEKLQDLLKKQVRYQNKLIKELEEEVRDYSRFCELIETGQGNEQDIKKIRCQFYYDFEDRLPRPRHGELSDKRTKRSNDIREEANEFLREFDKRFNLTSLIFFDII
jgi:hypothetical protein